MLKGQTVLYMIPGLLAGAAFYFIVSASNWFAWKVSSKKYRLKAYGLLFIYCLAAIAFSIFLAFPGGGGNWATHLQISGFLLAGCVLSFINR